MAKKRFSTDHQVTLIGDSTFNRIVLHLSRLLKIKPAPQSDVTETVSAAIFRKRHADRRGTDDNRSGTRVAAASSSSAAIGAMQGAFRPSATTVMLLAVSFYLIATTLPVTMCYVLFLSFPEGNHSITDADGGQARWADPTWSRHYVYRGVRTVVEEFGMSHYACNLYIYLATGRIFRRELCQLVRRCWRMDLGGGPTMSGSSSRSFRNGAAGWRRNGCGERRPGVAITLRRDVTMASRLNREDTDNEDNTHRASVLPAAATIDCQQDCVLLPNTVDELPQQQPCWRTSSQF